VVVVLVLLGVMNGASPRALLWGGAAWVIGWGLADIEVVTLCRLLGGWTVGASVVGRISLYVTVLLLGVPALRRLRAPVFAHATRPWHAAVRLGALYIVGANALAALLVYAMRRWLPPVHTTDSVMGVGWLSLTASPTALLLFVTLLVGLGPVAEECLFRGILLPWLTSWMPERRALAISSVLFGVAHVGYGYGMLMPTASGWVLGWARLRTGTLRASVSLHVLMNGVFAAVIFTPARAHLIIVVMALLALVVGGMSLIDDSAYRAKIEELRRSRETPTAPGS
jgi:membrane protease YdiL (CAAX protease family)